MISKKAPIKTIIAYTVGITLFSYGVIVLIVGVPYESFKDTFDSKFAIASFLISTGLAIAIYTEQLILRKYEQEKYINKLSNEITSKVMERLEKQINENVELLINESITKVADNISNKIRPCALRKEIAKQLVKSKRLDSFVEGVNERLDCIEKCVNQVKEISNLNKKI